MVEISNALAEYKKGQWFSFSNLDNKCFNTLIINDGSTLNEIEFNDIINSYIHKLSIPQFISDLQARLVLAQIGRLAEVEAMAAADPVFNIWFDRALVWERTNPYVVNAGLALGLTETQVDELFVLGATL